MPLSWYCRPGLEEANQLRAQPSRQYTSAHEGKIGRIALHSEGAIPCSTILAARELMAALQVILLIYRYNATGEDLFAAVWVPPQGKRALLA